MYKKKKIAAIIPVRGGSKGVPYKNLKFLGEKPLVYYILKTASRSKYLDNIFVNSEDEKILNYCENSFRKIETVKRPKFLSKDDITLDEVVCFFVKNKKLNYDYFITLQATSPLLKTESIDKAIEKLVDSKKQSLISVKEERHLFWYKKKNKNHFFYKTRKNRQQLKPFFLETGGIIASSKNYIINKNSRISINPLLFKISIEEALDIDDYKDFALANYFLNRPRIGIIVRGSLKTGSGHAYRGISIANSLNVKPLFLMNKKEIVAKKVVDKYNYNSHTYSSKKKLYKLLRQKNIDLIINDTLDTSITYIQKLKNISKTVITFEDLGAGAKYADACINALYEYTDSKEKNIYYGKNYVCLKPEFFLSNEYIVSKNCETILITFGGTDPNNITELILDLLLTLDRNYIFKVILGPGNNKIDRLKKKFKKNKNVVFLEFIKTMSKHMLNSDVCITSNGRTIYECVSIGVPTISISQNERELHHAYSYVSGLIYNLGLYNKSKLKKIFLNKFKELSENYNLRLKISDKMKEQNLKKGLSNVLKIIFDCYKGEKYEEF